MPFLKTTFLFQNVDEETYRSISKKISPQMVIFKDKAPIFTPETREKKIGFIVKGKCTVLRLQESGEQILLNKLSTGDAFGMLSMFGDNPYPTYVLSNGETTVLFLSKSECDYLITYPQIAQNMLSFVVNKAIFLNQKIAQLTEKDITAKLFKYLLNLSEKNGSTDFVVRLSDISRALGCGRASLYRAIKALEEKQAVTYQNNHIEILKKTT